MNMPGLEVMRYSASQCYRCSNPGCISTGRDWESHKNMTSGPSLLVKCSQDKEYVVWVRETSHFTPLKTLG